MEHVEVDLQEHEAWASSALAVLRQMPYDSQQRVLKHLFQVVAHVDLTDDRDAALRLCKDLASTTAMHQHDAYHQATLGMEPSPEHASVDDVLARFA